MSKTFSIQVEARQELGSSASRRLRREKQIPIVVYSRGQDAASFCFPFEQLVPVLRHSGLVEMTCTNDGGKKLTILKAVQRHPISNSILHLDFQEVRLDEEILSEVRVVSEGEAEGIHHGGQLEQAMFELQIRCLPTAMPEAIIVDVSGLALDSTLHVRDIVAPEGVSIVSDESLVVFQVRSPRVADVDDEEEEDEAAAAAAEGDEDTGDTEESEG